MTKVMVAAIAMIMLVPCLFALPVWAGAGDDQNSGNDSADLGVGTAPSAPRNLVADKGPGFVWLWWDHPANQGTDLIKNYTIYRGLASDGSGSVKIATLTVGPNSSIGANFYNDTHLVNSTIYYYRMTADSDAGSSGYSNIASATPAAVGNAPSGPQNLIAQNGIYTVQVNWTAPASTGSTPVRFYDIYREENGEFTSFFNYENMELWTTGYFDDDSDLLPGHLYNYTVRAINTYGAGASVDGVNLGGTGNVPGAPQNLTAHGGDEYVSLDWDYPVNPSANGITKFNIYRNQTGSSVISYFDSVDNDNQLQDSYYDDSVINGVNYVYQVTSVNGNGESGRSNEANATPELTPTSIYKPYYLDAYPGNGQVLLKWPTVFYNATGYQVFRSETSNGQGTSPHVNITTPTPYTNYYMLWYDNETTNGVTYYYKVKIVSMDAYVGPFSEEVNATPGPGTPPAAPTELIATPDDGGPLLYLSSISVTNAILWYEVYRADTSGGPDYVRIFNATEFSYYPGLFFWDDVPDSTTYYYKVKAVNMYGASAFSNEVSSFGSPTGDVPDPAIDLVATAGTNKITVSWNNPTYVGTANLLTYILMRNNGSGWILEDYRFETVGPQSFEDTFVVSGQSYQYQVFVGNQYGDAVSGSNIDSASVVVTPTAPSKPLNLVTDAGSNSVVLTWDPPSDTGSSVITGYTLLRGTSSGSITTVITTTAGNVLTFNDTTALNGQTYWYAVRATNSAGTGPLSDPATASPVAVQTPPTKPIGLVASPGNAQVILTWSAPSSTGGAAISRYDIFRGYGSGNISTTALASVTMPGTLTYTDSSALNGVEYWYVVKAVNTKGSSPASDAANATPSATGTAPGAPTSPAAVGYPGYILISWATPSNVGSGVSSYQIFRATTAGGQGSTALVTVAGSMLAYNDTNATPGTPYFYKVRGVNSYGNGALSAEVNATASSTGVPTIPTNLAATPDGGKIILTWDVPTSDGGSAITGYKVLRGANASSLTQIGTTDATKRSYTDEEVTEGQTYYYAVMAVNANGNGSQPTPVSAVPEASGDDGGSDNTWLYVGAGVAAVAVIGGLAYFLMRKKP